MVIVQWLARGLGTLMVLMIAAFAAGEGVPPLTGQSGPVVAESIGMAVMAMGLVAAWRWPLAGGLATVGGYALFQAAEMSAHHRLAGGWPFTLFLVAGLLHVAAGLGRGQAGAAGDAAG